MTKKTRSAPRKGRGTVIVIATLFLVSAVVRFAVSANAVFASESVAMERDALEINGSGITVKQNDELEAMLRSFEKREVALQEREDQLQKRLRALSIAEETVNKRLAELIDAEQNLRSTMALASTAAENDLQKLTAVYENMKPKVAAALFEEMDADFAAGFLGRMRPDSAASIMAGMTPNAAYSISAILAGRNANVPTE